MTARVLVVDDILPNVKLLEAKLSAEYFDVLTATSGAEALELVRRELPDIVLLDVMMPEMDGFEVCRRIRADPATAHIPIVMVTALDQQSDRVMGLEAGADDFLTKPVKDMALLARVRSLVRLKVTMDEYRNREATQVTFGGEGTETEIELDPSTTNILLVEDHERTRKNMEEALSGVGKLCLDEGSQKTADIAKQRSIDLVIVSLSLQNIDGLRIVSQLRSVEATRQLPILALVEEDDTRSLVRALEMGVNDYLVRPPEAMELQARVKTQLRRKRFADQLRENLHLSMKLATTDAITGLYNRHYMTSHLDTLVKAAIMNFKPLCLLMLDIDDFKIVNDTYGHAAGDEVLHEFANRIARNIRGVDLAARCGGEEFVVIMPDTKIEDALVISERLLVSIAESAIAISNQKSPVSITTSGGLAELHDGKNPSPEDMMERADTALYAAKHAGKNRVETAQ